MLFVWVMGTLDFPKKTADAIERWRALPLDYRGFGDWPEEGFFSADGDATAATVGEALDRIQGFPPQIPTSPPLTITVKGTSVGFRGFLDEAQFVELHCDLGAAIRRAAELGASGAVVLTEEIGDFAYRFQLKKGKSVFDELEPEVVQTILRAGTIPAGRAQATTGAAPAPVEAGAAPVSLGFSPEAEALHRRIGEALDAASPATLASAASEAGGDLSLYVQPSGTRPLASFGDGGEIRRVIQRGSAALKLDSDLTRDAFLDTALRLLAAVDLGAATPIARELVRAPAAPAPLRQAALRVLGRSADDGALDALLGVLSGPLPDQAPPLWRLDRGVAATALGASPSVKAGERLAALIPAKVEALTRATHPAELELAELAVKALGLRRHAPSAGRLLAIWRATSDAPLRQAAGEALLQIGDPAAIEAIAASLKDTEPHLASLPIRATLMRGAPAAHDALAPLFEESSLSTPAGNELAVGVLHALQRDAALARGARGLAGDRPHGWLDADQRWVDLLLRLLPRDGIGWNALQALPFAADARVLPALLARLGEDKLPDVLEALQAHGDPAAIPALEERLAKTRKKGEAAKIQALIDNLRARSA